MTATQSLNLYNISLRYFKNEADASAFVKEIEVVVDNKFDTKKDTLATKEDIANLRLATKEEVANVRFEIKETKTELIKWVFAFFVTLVVMILGLYFKK